MQQETKVLIVDDSSFMLSMVSGMLKDTEFTVVGTAKNGTEALSKYKELKPDIVLLDIVMPDEAGDITISKILEFNRLANVIMVSSLGTQEKVVDCLRKGARHFIQKPFEQEDLLQVLRKVVKK